MQPLPSCEYRVDLSFTDKYFCRHSGVQIRDSIVTSAICRHCPQRNLNCEEPRPAPSELQLSAKLAVPLAEKVFNFTSAVAAFVSDGFQLVDKETYAERMAVCELCELRSGNYCGKCGCALSLKASGRVFQCPIGKWGKTED